MKRGKVMCAENEATVRIVFSVILALVGISHLTLDSGRTGAVETDHQTSNKYLLMSNLRVFIALDLDFRLVYILATIFAASCQNTTTTISFPSPKQSLSSLLMLNSSALSDGLASENLHIEAINVTMLIPELVISRSGIEFSNATINADFFTFVKTAWLTSVLSVCCASLDPKYGSRDLAQVHTLCEGPKAKVAYKDETANFALDNISNQLDISSNTDEATNELLFEYPELSSSINPQLNPCDDFYEFVCSGWHNSNVIQNDKTAVNQFGIIAETIENRIKCR
ncbi:peptidase family m13 domain-containing protein [Ditylenchus destructor]|uniref:Peptidase family m13 domain-containing protein n=1 Tax=Ditylenchus destructor TaxID=166010 RepID=A0AAD4RCA0_9BILA|nr:peptidase family m13 domain-containing protein [Ditylenchus destructor]